MTREKKLREVRAFVSQAHRDNCAWHTEKCEKRIDDLTSAITELYKVSEEALRRIIIDNELTPRACEDSGQVEWSAEESRKLAQAIVAYLQR